MNQGSFGGEKVFMQIPRRALFGKLNAPLFRAVESATALAKLKGHAYVELLHWLYQVWQIPDGDMRLVLAAQGVNESQLDLDFIQAMQKLPIQDGGLHDFSHQIERVIEKAWGLATLSCGDNKIRSAWLLTAMLMDTQARTVLQAISPQLLKWPSQASIDSLKNWIKGSSEEAATVFQQDDQGGASASTGELNMSPAESAQSALQRYCSDLTSLAEQGRIDPVIAREHEVRTLVDIVLRRRQNNPLLTGSAGVGKTAVVEGLALAIVDKKVPPTLQQTRLLSLDVGALLAGASMRGEFESRLKQLLKEASDSPTPVIMFIDEVHTLVGAGGQSGTADAANLLKPALARGGLRCIGATTWSEYKKYIEKDPALTRRFQVLQVPEPEEAQAVSMVRSLVPAFVKHHQVVVLDEAVKAAVTLSHRYIPARQLPDKAVSLLDTACARVALSLHAPPHALQECEAQILDQQAQLQMLEHEATAGYGNPEAIDMVQHGLAQLKQTQHQIHQRWAEEKKLVEALVAMWQPSDPDRIGQTDRQQIQDASAQQETLASLQTKLQTIQDDRPEIHPVVSAAVVASIVSDWTGTRVGALALTRHRPALTASSTTANSLQCRLCLFPARSQRAALGAHAKPRRHWTAHRQSLCGSANGTVGCALMGRKIIVVGDPTDHGGQVISGSPTQQINGKAIARLGDQVDCPQKGHGVNAIVEGDPSMLINGIPVALAGHKTACGCTLLGTSNAEHG